jgi:hypothetical protein
MHLQAEGAARQTLSSEEDVAFRDVIAKSLQKKPCSAAKSTFEQKEEADNMCFQEPASKTLRFNPVVTECVPLVVSEDAYGNPCYRTEINRRGLPLSQKRTKLARMSRAHDFFNVQARTSCYESPLEMSQVWGYGNPEDQEEAVVDAELAELKKTANKAALSCDEMRKMVGVVSVSKEKMYKQIIAGFQQKLKECCEVSMLSSLYEATLGELRANGMDLAAKRYKFSTTGAFMNTVEYMAYLVNKRRRRVTESY